MAGPDNRRYERSLVAPSPVTVGRLVGPLEALVVTFGPPGQGHLPVILGT